MMNIYPVWLTSKIQIRVMIINFYYGWAKKIFFNSNNQFGQGSKKLDALTPSAVNYLEIYTMTYHVCVSLN